MNGGGGKKKGEEGARRHKRLEMNIMYKICFKRRWPARLPFRPSLGYLPEIEEIVVSETVRVSATLFNHEYYLASACGRVESNPPTCKKGLRDRNSPTCTLSQNGYGDVFVKTAHHWRCSDTPLVLDVQATGLEAVPVTLEAIRAGTGYWHQQTVTVY